VTANEHDYLISPDDGMPVALRSWAMVKARVVDEITGHPPRGDVRLSVAQRRLAAKVASDGLLGAVSRPWNVYSPLLAPDFKVDLRIDAEGFLPMVCQASVLSPQRALTVPAISGDFVLTLASTAGLRPGQFLLIGPADGSEELARIVALGPGASQVTLASGVVNPHAGPVVADEFTPADLGVLALHRRPVVIRGRVVWRGVGPLPGATVRVTKIWRQPPPFNVATDPEPPVPGMVPPPGAWPPSWTPPVGSIDPPLYRDRVAGATVTVHDVAAAPGTANKFLLDAVPAGGAVVRLSNRDGVGPTDLVLVDADDPDRMECLPVTAVDGASTADQPARVTLAFGCARAHRAGALVVKAGAPVLGASAPINYAAAAADVCLLFDTRTFSGTHLVQVADPGPPPRPEYHRLRLFHTLADAGAYYRLPPLSRVGKLEVLAESLPLPAVPIDWNPDYSSLENQLDIMFP
jgi:hypothetical protein